MLEVPWDLHLESCVWNIEKKEKKDDKQLSQENDLQKLVQLHVQERDVTVKEKILLKEKRKEDRDIMLRLVLIHDEETKWSWKRKSFVTAGKTWPIKWRRISYYFKELKKRSQDYLSKNERNIHRKRAQTLSKN